MKLQFHGHDERYTVEQSLLNLFPGERPVYSAVSAGEDNAAVITLEEIPRTPGPSKTVHEQSDTAPGPSDNTHEQSDTAPGPSDNTPDDTLCRVTTELSYGGKSARQICEKTCSGTDYQREGIRRYLIGRCFYLAACQITGATPPWGMLSGVRPDKIVSRAFLRGESESQIRRTLTEDYFVTSDRAALAIETGRAAYRTAQSLTPRDIAVYVGIPFCPTRCAYCSFVSESVEKRFALVAPYMETLVEEIRDGGALAQKLGLRVRAFYMGGGTPAVLSPDQMRRVLTVFREAFDTSDCAEYTVEAGRPDAITPELLAALHECGVDRVCVNPQTMEPDVLRTIGRRHTPEDTERAMKLAVSAGFAHINMDLIAGLPGDSFAGFVRTLSRCLAFAPDNLTVHTLALKKGSRLLTGHPDISGARGNLPDAQTVSDMLTYAVETLRGNGYAPYYLYRQKYMSGSFENTGWTFPGAECLYNILIMSELCGILSFGAGGSTKLLHPAENRILRLFNPKYPEEYIARADKRQHHLSAITGFYQSRTDSSQFIPTGGPES